MRMESCDVAVIGGGPAGVAAALELKAEGVARVTLFERESYLGGATRHCAHSPFGMLEFGRVYFGSAYGKRLEREVAKAGVDLCLGHSITSLGEDGTLGFTNPKGLGQIRARRVVLATGIRETSRAGHLISGDRPVGVLTTGALQEYVAFHRLMPFRRPVIVGSELVSQSAVLTCLTHGAKPVALVESAAVPLARAPFRWLPALARIPLHTGARIIDIRGKGRVEEVVIEKAGRSLTLPCDGVLFSGRFTPEASLPLSSGFALAPGSRGPAIDQFGRSENPIYFAAGNMLRAVETAGWCFREGRRIGRAVAADLRTDGAAGRLLRVTHDPRIKLVVPTLLRPGEVLPAALPRFQLRFQTPVKGRLILNAGGEVLWSRFGDWRPERRILVPIPADVTQDLSLTIEG